MPSRSPESAYQIKGVFSVGAFGIAAYDAELIALWIREHHPAGAIRVSSVCDLRRAELQHPLDFLVPGAIRGREVKVHSILDLPRVTGLDEQEPMARCGILLDCSDDERRRRPASRCGQSEVIDALADAARYRSLGLTVIDTTGRPLDAVAADLVEIIESQDEPSWS